MPRHKLTKTLLDSLQTTAVRGEKYFDTTCTGFLVTVYPSGKKTFAIWYGPENKRKLYTIGRYGVLTVEEAREIARRHLAKVIQGGDPRAEQVDKRNALTLQDWVKEYLESIKERKKSYKSDVQYLKMASGQWGETPIQELSAREITKFMSALAESRGTTTANRWLASLKTCLSSAWRMEKTQQNVALRVRMFPENPPRFRTLSDEEMKRVLASLEKLPDLFARAAFILLVETGARCSEVLRAKWEDIDLKGKLWRLPSPKSGKPQVIPLAAGTVKLLAGLSRPGPFVIPGRFPENGRYDLKKPWEFIKEDAQLEGVTIHDIRRTFGLQIARTAGLHVASKLLRHSNITITEQVYAPLGIDELRKATENLNRLRKRKRQRQRKKSEKGTAAEN